MAKFKINFAFLIFTVIYSCSGTPVDDFYKGMVSFASDFYLQCAKSKPGNMIISPLSVSNALALLMQGAEGSTFEQLSKGLHLGNDKSVVANQFLENHEALEENLGRAKLSIANRIYVKQGYSLNKNFEEVAVSKFRSGIESLNFAEADKSAETINHFVSEETNGKIKEIVKSDQLNANTRSVLVNAIYFKADWEKRFNSDQTEKADFYVSETEKVSTDFMSINSEFNIASVEELDAKVLEMKYVRSNITFGIVLPNQRMGLAALETKLKDFDCTKTLDKFISERVQVFIPKFKVEYEINLNDVLKSMGITEIFSDGANLRGLLDSNEQLKVSDIIHKAFIQVTEKGTEAGASTVQMIVPMSMPILFNADHPFIFYIRETQTNTILFNGRIEKF